MSIALKIIRISRLQCKRIELILRGLAFVYSMWHRNQPLHLLQQALSASKESNYCWYRAAISLDQCLACKSAPGNHSIWLPGVQDSAKSIIRKNIFGIFTKNYNYAIRALSLLWAVSDSTQCDSSGFGQHSLWFSTVRTALRVIHHSFGQHLVWFITVSDSTYYDSAQFRTVLSMIQHSFGQYSVWFSTVSYSTGTQYSSAQFRTPLSMTSLEALHMIRCCLGLHSVWFSTVSDST